jgi:hypothetical protein
MKQTAVQRAAACGRYILQNFGRYENNTKSVPVSLSLHCGLSAGDLHCMWLGTEQRMEWLISGPQLRDMGLAATDAKAGQLCISPDVLRYLKNPAAYEQTPSGNYLITPHHTHQRSSRTGKEKNSNRSTFSLNWLSSLFSKPTSSASENIPSTAQEDDGVSFKSSRRKDFQQLLSPDSKNKELYEVKKSILARFIHECARPHILLSDTNFLAEIRHVVTVFIEFLNLQDDFDLGEIERPQLALTTVLEVLNKVGGVLRQYVVDDKGIVMICSFGLPNFNYSDNELKAVIASLAILSSLEDCDIICRIGISGGQAYCGYVGSDVRKEYCVMGPSVNLAARLMNKANSGQILLSDAIYEVVEDHFVFKTLDKILAKGYADPIRVYSPVRNEGECQGCMTSDTNRLIGRQSELSILKGMVSLCCLGKTSRSVQSNILSPQLSFMGQEFGDSNRLLVLAPDGYGKSMLISTLCNELKCLKKLIPARCHRRMEPYQGMFVSICSLLNLVNPFTISDCLSSNCDVCDYGPPMRELYEAICAWVQQYNIPLYLSEIPLSHPQTSSVQDDSYSFIFATEVLPVIEILLTSSVVSLDDWSVDQVNAFFLQVLLQMILNSPGRTLIIEDIQWCDLESYNILLRMINSFDGGCIILTMSPSGSPGRRPNLSSSLFHGKQVDLDDLTKIFKVLELKRFTLNDIKVCIRRFFGPALLASHPDLTSDATVHLIFNQTELGVPSLVVSQLEEMMSTLKSKCVQLTPISKTAIWETDGLDLDCRIVLKVASVCGSVFSSSLVTSTLEDLDYKDISDNHERIFALLQKKRLIRTTYSGVPYLQSDQFTADTVSPLRRSPAYCFFEKSTLDSIYGSLLDSQREAMHVSIARGIEADYKKNSAQYSDHVIIFLAHHWSRAGICYLNKKVEYYQLAAVMTYNDGLYGETRSYYEQLISMSLQCLSIEDVLKKFFSITSFTKSLKIHIEENYLVRQQSQTSFSRNILFSNYYLSHEEDFEGIVTSTCSSISLIQLSSYFVEMSAIEFQRHEYILSRNLFEFIFFIGGMKLQFAITFLLTKTYLHIFSLKRNRKIMSMNFTNQGIMSLLRGRNEEALRYLQYAMQLLDTRQHVTELCHIVQTLSIFALTLLSQGKISKSQKIWKQAKKLVVKQVLDPVTLSYLQLYSSIHHLCLGEFSQAESELVVNRNMKIDTMGLIPCCSKLLEAWISFMSGNCRRVENLTSPSSLNGDSSPEMFLYDIWTRQLRVILNGFRGNFLLARRELSQLDALQSSSGQPSKLYHNCLFSFLEICENQYCSPTGGLQRQQLIKRLLTITSKLHSNSSWNLLSIVLSFLIACCCGILLEKIPRDHWTVEDEKMVSPFIAFILKVISEFNSISSTYHFVVVLKEVLEVKLFRQSLTCQSLPFVNDPHLKKFLHSTTVTVEYFHQTPNTQNSISLYPDFAFGVTWWRVEMFKTVKLLNFNDDMVEEYYQTALGDLKDYLVPRDHPFSVDYL